jgi:hypothetical protein
MPVTGTEHRPGGEIFPCPAVRGLSHELGAYAVDRLEEAVIR